MIPAIHYITTISYILVHPLARAPETRLTHYLVARPGATVDGAKYITWSPRRLNIRQRWPDTYVPAIPWPSNPTTQKGYNRYTYGICYWLHTFWTNKIMATTMFGLYGRYDITHLDFVCWKHKLMSIMYSIRHNTMLSPLKYNCIYHRIHFLINNFKDKCQV